MTSKEQEEGSDEKVFVVFLKSKFESIDKISPWEAEPY